MESSGHGLTFSDVDVARARELLSLVNSSEFKVSAKKMIDGAHAIAWFCQLIPQMEANVLEVVKISKLKADKKAKA